MNDTIIATKPMQLVVFEKKTARSAYRYLATYSAGSQEELTASENTIRKTYEQLHLSFDGAGHVCAGDDVRWVVVATEGSVPLEFWSMNQIKGRGRLRRSVPKSLPSIDHIGAVVLEFPEDDTPKCATCGAMVAVIGSMKKCTVCGSVAQ